MIQRIQTIFLFLVAVAMILVVIFPIWTQDNPDQSIRMTLDAWALTTYNLSAGEETAEIASESKFYIGLLAIIAAALALFSIFQYKNRARQMMFNMINSFVMVMNVGVIVWTTHSANEVFNPNVSGDFDLGFWAIFAAMILNLLANRFIRKDEMLVRSVDRIR